MLNGEFATGLRSMILTLLPVSFAVSVAALNHRPYSPYLSLGLAALRHALRSAIYRTRCRSSQRAAWAPGNHPSFYCQQGLTGSVHEIRPAAICSSGRTER